LVHYLLLPRALRFRLGDAIVATPFLEKGCDMRDGTLANQTYHKH